MLVYTEAQIKEAYDRGFAAGVASAIPVPLATRNTDDDEVSAQ